MKHRVLVAALSFSAAGFLGLVGHEHYTEKAVLPGPKDVPTVGIGTTVYPDGTRVKMGDRTTPVKAIGMAIAHATKDEVRFKASMPDVLMHQAEYDMWLSWVYQFGIGKWIGSSMHNALLRGDYRGACEALLMYRFIKKADCSKAENQYGRGADCRGVWVRAQANHAKCVQLL
jgi:lysozyme